MIDPARKFVLDLARKGQEATLDLAWRLGSILAEQKFKEWQFPSFNAYLESDLANTTDDTRYFFSKTYCYSLAKMGVILSPQKEVITKKFNKGLIGIKALMEMANEIDRSVENRVEVHDAVINKIVHDIPLPFEIGPKSANPGPGLTKFSIYVKTDLLDAFRSGLQKFGILNTVTTLEECMVGAAIDFTHSDMVYWQTADRETPTTYRRFEELIESGRFLCKLCKKIPLVPTWHHVFPRSVAFGYGPQVVLCAEPCHYSIVQSHWREYAEKWDYDIETELAKCKAEAGNLEPQEDIYDENGDD